MTMKLFFLIALGVSVANVPSAAAQARDTTSVKVGMRALPGRVDVHDLSAFAVPSLHPAVDASRGPPRTPWEGALRGARHGALVGAGITLALSALALREDLRGECDGCIPATPVVAAFGIVITAGTTLFGAGVGAAAPGWHSRQPLPAPQR